MKSTPVGPLLLRAITPVTRTVAHEVNFSIGRLSYNLVLYVRVRLGTAGFGVGLDLGLDI